MFSKTTKQRPARKWDHRQTSGRKEVSLTEQACGFLSLAPRKLLQVVCRKSFSRMRRFLLPSVCSKKEASPWPPLFGVFLPWPSSKPHRLLSEALCLSLRVSLRSLSFLCLYLLLGRDRIQEKPTADQEPLYSDRLGPSFVLLS